MKNILISKKLFIGFLLISNYILKAQFDPYDNLIMQKKTIMGTWVNSGYNDDEVGDSRWTMKFTAEGKCFDSYAYDNGKKDIDVYSYKIEKGTTESGLTVYSLDLYGISDSNEHYSYEVYAYKNLDEDFYRMALHYLGTKELPTIKNYTFKKIRGSSSSETPSKEEEKKSEVSPRWELVKSSDYDKGYLDGGLAYEQCKNEQVKEGSDVLDGDRRMPMKRMGDYKAFPLGMDDCREEAFERIKLRSNEYRRGFEEGWKDASMPANKDKKHKTKVYNN